MRGVCVRCQNAPAVDAEGYCGHCHWAVRAEVEQGFFQIREHLRNDPHVGYVEFCREHGLEP